MFILFIAVQHSGLGDDLGLKPDQRAPLAAEFDADAQDRQALGAVFVGIAAVFELLQGVAFRLELDDLEFEQPELAIEAQAQVELAVTRGIFGGQVEAERGSANVSRNRVLPKRRGRERK